MATTSSADRPVSPLDREAVARVEVGHTTIARGVAVGLVAWFAMTLAVLPAVERLRTGEGGAGALGAWTGLARVPDDVGRASATAGEVPGATAWQRLVAGNRALLAGLSAFEDALEDRSNVGRLLRPHVQVLLSGWLGAGNERAYVGRDGWLFFRPDVEYVTGPGFLDRRQLARRIAAAAEYETPPNPDPRPAIRSFARDLDRRGISLVVVPTPVKPSVHPGQLTARAGARAAPLQNASYDGLLVELRRDGILVFDPAELIGQGVMGRGEVPETPLYLKTDTHWRPETMRRTAESLAAFLREHVTLPERPAPSYRVEPREARQLGDTLAMLDLPPYQRLFAIERVALDFVVGPDGDPWRPSREADVLVLGDSFSNIYSLPTMGWGEAAGFVEHLSLALGRPVDRLVQNDEGASATRRQLAREATGTAGDRLDGKRVVVWQFATRELAFGDWDVIALAAPAR